MSLTDLIKVIPPDTDDDPEDIFAAAPGLIFTEDLRNHHGDEGDVLVYHSQRFGNIELRAAQFESESHRKLFAHYLWNAGIKMAELVSGDEPKWSVRDQTVLELGAGVGLVGIMATLAGAKQVTITDHPTPALLKNIQRNAAKAVPEGLRPHFSVSGYEWGDTSSPFAMSHANVYGRIIAADCYWMPHEHGNLVKSMLHLLSTASDARVYAIAGFHTGRAKVAAFFDEAVAQGLDVEEMYEEDHVGNRRDWMKERDGGTEHVTERKKWLVVALLKRREP